MNPSIIMAAAQTAVAVAENEPLLTNGELITIGAMIASVTAIVVTNKNTTIAVKEDIARLEAKQDKYNNLQERIATEESRGRSAHNRLDDLKELFFRFEGKLDLLLNNQKEHVEEFHTHKEE